MIGARAKEERLRKRWRILHQAGSGKAMPHCIRLVLGWSSGCVQESAAAINFHVSIGAGSVDEEQVTHGAVNEASMELWIFWL